MTDEELEAAINGVWIFIAGILCFLLQAGFGLLEVGSIRAKNAQNVILKNILDACVAALAYWAFGFGFAFGEGGNPFIGLSYFFLSGYDDFVSFFFFYVFAGTTATIVSGAVAERCRFRAYLIYSFVLTGFIYPVVSHWIWTEDGFFYGKVFDFAGGGAVHMVGGTAAFAGAWILGPRIGRFKFDSETNTWISIPIPGHDSVLAATGTFILWFGFFPFNAAAGGSIVGQGLSQVGRVATVTALAGAAGCMTLLCVGIYFKKDSTIDLGLSMNGLLAGMVATCSGVGYFDPWVGLIVGSTGALVYYAMAWVMEFKWRIDDPLGAAPLHLGAGAWGMILVAFFANPAYLDDVSQAGIFYGGDGMQLAWQLAAIAANFSWSMATCSLMFWTMNYFGIFRVSEEVERMGMDMHHHGGAAYTRGSVVPSTKSQMISNTVDIEKGAEIENDDNKKMSTKATDPEPAEMPKPQSRTSAGSRGRLSRRYSSTTVAIFPGAL